MAIPVFNKLLAIPHVWEEIFGYFTSYSEGLVGGSIFPFEFQVDDEERSTRRRSLASLARVCKSFTDPALRVLWRSLDDFEPILRLLPTAVDEADEAFPIPLKLLTREEWARFQEYAVRVRFLRWGLSDGCVVQTSVWSMLKYHCGNDPLLPYIRSLDLIDIYPDEPALGVLLSPSIHRLTLTLRTSSAWHEPVQHGTRPPVPPVNDLFCFICSQCPQLASLQLYNLFIGSPELSLTPLIQLARLETLVLPGAPIDYPTFRQLSYLPSLRVLEAEVKNLSSIGHLKLGGALERMSDLCLIGDIHDLVPVFCATRCQDLNTLRLTVMNDTVVEVLQDTLQTICDRVPKELTAFHLFIDAELRSMSYPLSHIVHAYLPFRAIRAVKLHFHNYLPLLSDEDAFTLARAWPELTSFKLRAAVHAAQQDSGHLTIGGLAEFTRLCPHLACLAIPLLDVRVLPAAPLGRQGARNTVLRLLHVESFIGGETANLLDVAAALDDFFPCLSVPDVVTMAQIVSFDISAHQESDPTVQMTDLLLAGIRARRNRERSVASAEADQPSLQDLAFLV